MAGANGEDVEEGAQERKRGLSGSMSLRTRKLGRRLSRSMSIVALKLPEKAQSITRSSSKLMRSGSRDKKNRSFELSIILPDKTQKQTVVWGNAAVAEVVCEPLQEAGAVVAGLPSGPLSAPVAVTLGGPLPSPTSLPAPPAPPAALLFLGGSKAPVDARAPAASLEGEVLVVEYQPPQWDGKDLDTFLAWEKIYASTLFSAVELYGKPLLRAAVITKEEYHLLFYYLESVSEASEALTERMRKYIDSGLLINEGKKTEDTISVSSKQTDKETEQKSILKELVQEGVLCQRDLDASSEITTSDFHEQSTESRKYDDNESIISSVNTSLRKVIVDIPIDCNESVTDSSIIETSDNVTTVTIRSGGQCCADHRISADASENVWANVRWDFLNPTDFGYDQVRSVQRSRSDSALTPLSRRRNEEIYERLRDVEGESCGSITPYESIEDLYDCIKNSQYTSAAGEESSPSTESQSEPQFPDFFEKASTIRQSSACSEKSGDSSVFPFSKCGSSDSAGAMTSCESTSGISTFVSKSMPESLKCRELPPPPAEGDATESAILLKQLFMGELMDAYNEFLSAYPHARALLRRKARRDEHFTALADIRRGAAKYTIGDYLQLPIEEDCYTTKSGKLRLKNTANLILTNTYDEKDMQIDGSELTDVTGDNSKDQPTTSVQSILYSQCDSSVQTEMEYSNKTVMVKPTVRSIECQADIIAVADSEKNMQSQPSPSTPSRSSTPTLYEPSTPSTSSTAQEALTERKDISGRTHILNIIKENPKMYLGVPKAFYWFVDLLAKQCKLRLLHVIVTLFKLKQNDTIQRLSHHFQLSQVTIQELLRISIPHLATYLQMHIYLPDPLTIKKTLPAVFKVRYANIQCILDCFEIQIEKASNSVMQSTTWSQYKSCNTLKYLIACCPNGFICYISKGIGGRISDKAITERSGFVDILPPGAVVLADRGFKGIESILAQKHVKLLRPPSVSSKETPTKYEVIQTKIIASLRIHVERVIRRLREFAFLKPHSVINHNHVKYVDEAVIIACGLVNLQDNIIKM